ncbi:hypothetical protein Tco_0863962, partial [Tanacetum coccineum]
NGYPRKGQKSKPKRQNRARERKDREKSKSQSQPRDEALERASKTEPENLNCQRCTGGRGRVVEDLGEGNDERVDELNGQGNDQCLGANGGIEGVNGNVKGVNGDKNVRNVIVNDNRVVCSYKEFLACNPKEYDGKGGKDLMWWNSQIHTLSREVVVSMSWNDFKFMMIEEFCPSHEMQKLVPHLVTPESRNIERFLVHWPMRLLGNGSIKKVEKRGNVGEPSKDKNGRDDNKMTRT